MANKEKRAKRAKTKAKSQRVNKQKTAENSHEDSFNQPNFSDIFQKEDKEPRQMFGYNRERRTDEDPFSFPEDGLICMVSEIIDENRQPIFDDTGIDFKVGDWFVSEVISGHDHKIHGAFQSEVEAMDFGLELGVKSYRSTPQFESF